jgi:ABC-type protease/lipase transport system fused ATPase/permease subunit
MRRVLLAILIVVSPLMAQETLLQKQERFACQVSSLLHQAEAMGYMVTLGEAWRSEEQAAFKLKLDAQKGIGIANSLHTLRLAIDLNLFRNGVYLTATKDYEPLGRWWEQSCKDCRWGGRFKRADGNHFSIEHGGVR